MNIASKSPDQFGNRLCALCPQPKFYGRRRLIFRATLVCCLICVSLLDCAIAQQASAPNPFKDYQTLSELAYRNPDDVRLLGSIEADLKRGRVAGAIPAIQKLLNRTEDSFFRAKPPILKSLRVHLDGIVGAQSPEFLRDYERFAGQTARMQLENAIATQDTVLLDQVARQYLHTKAGFMALRMRALLFVDEGRPHAALNLLSRAIDAKAHPQKLRQPAFRIQLALALRAAGHNSESSAVLAELTATDPRSTDIVNRLQPFSPQTKSPDWMLPFGSASANRQSSASTPWLNPGWSAEFNNEQFNKLLDDWNEGEPNPIGQTAANYSISVGNTLIMRDFSDIRAFHLESGAELWNFTCKTDLSKVIGTAGFQSERSLRQQTELLGNGVAGTLTSNGDMVFAVDNIQNLQDDGNQYRGRSILRFQQPVPGAAQVVNKRATPTNSLIALAVHPRKQKIVPAWSIGGATKIPDWFLKADANHDDIVTTDELKDNPGFFQRLDRDHDSVLTVREAAQSIPNQPPFADYFFLGPPLPIGNQLFAIAEHDGQLSCVALDAKTGKRIWEQGIGYPNTRLIDHPSRGRYVCSPAYRNGIIVCPHKFRCPGRAGCG